MGSSRTPIVGGNWKMNTLAASATALAKEVLAGCAASEGACDVVVYPPFPYLPAVAGVLRGSAIRLGGQDLFHEDAGAYTGEVSAGMLRDVGAVEVLAGHSERRHLIGEDDTIVNRKVRAGLEAGLAVTLCVGETLEQRQAGQTDAVNLGQVSAGLLEVPAGSMSRLRIAYEPVWAIGTGETATPEDAESVHRLIRDRVAELYDESVADSLRIQYGGSVKGNNAAELFSQPNIDGGLVGGASLDGEQFATIVQAAARTAKR
jgi:triosephosphate isomerase